MGTEVRVDTIPSCDVHDGQHPAVYDGRTVYGSWAYMCQDAFDLMGVGLGTGSGQRLVLKGAK